jgi:hypothetical protein
MFEVPGLVNGHAYKGAQEKNCVIKVKDRKFFSALRFRIDVSEVMSCDITCRI